MADTRKLPVNILLVEKSGKRSKAVRSVFTGLDSFAVTLSSVNAAGAALTRLEEDDIGIVLVGDLPKSTDRAGFADRCRAQSPAIVLVDIAGPHTASPDCGNSFDDFASPDTMTSALLECIVRNALARQRLKDEAAAQASLLETILQNTGAGIAALDADGHLIARNDRFDDVLSAVECNSDTSGNELHVLKSRLALSQGRPFELADADDRVWEIRRNRTPLNGSVIFAVDVSDQKVLQENLRAASRDAEEASRSKSSFLANVSHELRTPLNSIIGFSDVIIGQYPDCDPVPYAREVNQSGRHLLGLINTFLDFSKMEAGKFDCHDESLDMDDIFRFCTRQVSTEAANRNISIEYDTDPELFALIGDEMAMRRMVINCLSNAVRFSHEEGRVTVSVGLTADGGADISISDDGIGMDPAKVDQAFVPFRQMHDTFNREYGGSGLGLSIVKSLASLHDATIRVDTAVGEGTCISIGFPPSRVWTQQSRSRAAG